MVGLSGVGGGGGEKVQSQIQTFMVWIFMGSNLSRGLTWTSRWYAELLMILLYRAKRVGSETSLNSWGFCKMCVFVCS